MEWKVPPPTEHDKGRDIHDPVVSTRVIYEIDTQQSDRRQRYDTMAILLRPIQQMPATLERCDAIMSRMGTTDTIEWQKVAEGRRKAKLAAIEKKITAIEARRKDRAKIFMNTEPLTYKLARGDMDARADPIHPEESRTQG